MLKKIALMGACVASAFAMHTGEVNINDVDLEVGAKFDVGQFNHNVEPDTMFIGAKILHADKAHSSKENRSLDPYAELSFLMQKELGKSGVRLGMGAKLNYTKDYAALPLGLDAAYRIPAATLVPMYLSGSLYYAPKVLSFNDGKGFVEYRVSYDVEIIDNGRITVGYRNIETNYEFMDYTYNKSWYVGFKIGF